MSKVHLEQRKCLPSGFLRFSTRAPFLFQKSSRKVQTGVVFFSNMRTYRIINLHLKLHVDLLRCVQSEGQHKISNHFVTPLKYVGGVRICFDPQNVTFLIQNCCWVSLQVSPHKE